MKPINKRRNNKLREKFALKRIVAFALIFIIELSMVLPLLTLQAKADTLEGLFAGKFSAGSQIFDCQRSRVEEGVWEASYLDIPGSRNERFTEAELENRYFAFRDTGTTTTSGYDSSKTVPLVALYLFDAATDLPVNIAGKTDADGRAGSGTIEIVADEGILYIGDGYWGTLISNAAGYHYGDFSESSLYLRENSIEAPSIEDLRNFEATDVLLEGGEILLRFYANGENVTGMPSPNYRIKGVGVNFTIAPSLSPSRSGYTFAGWNRHADGSGVTYVPGAVYSSDVGLSLYAQWIADTSGLLSQTAPTGVSTVNAAAHGGNGALSATAATMQYRTAADANTWYWCADTSTSVPSGDYWVRYAPKDGYNASPEVYVGSVLAPAETPDEADFTVTHLSAVGGGDGSITQLKAGVAYEYRTAGSGAYQSVADGKIQNLSVSSIEVRVKEVSGVALASLPLTLYVKQPAAAKPAAGAFTITNVTTYNGYDGKIGGVDNTLEYGETWNGSIQWNGVYSTEVTYLSAGEYYIRYAATSTDLASDYITLYVKQPAPSPISGNVVDATTYGGSDGSIVNLPDNMKKQYTIGTNPTVYTVDEDEDITGLPAGEVHVSIPEGNTVFASVSPTTFTINQPIQTAVAPSGLVAVNSTAYGYPGSITGTTDQMEYSSDGVWWSGCSDSSTEIYAGVYSVRFRASSPEGLSPSAKITVKQPAPTISARVTNATSFGGADGKITGLPWAGTEFEIKYTLGTDPAVYSVEINEDEITGLSAGEVHVYIPASDTVLASSIFTYTVKQPAPAINATVRNAATYGGADGSIIGLPSGMVKKYTVGSDATQHTVAASVTSITGLPAGEVHVSLPEAGYTLASGTAIYTIMQPAPAINATVNNATTYGGADGSITGLPSGVIKKYTLGSGTTEYTVAANVTSITGLFAGEVHVKLPATGYTLASATTTYVIGQPVLITEVTLSTDQPQVGTPITVSLTPAAATGNFSWQYADGTVLGTGPSYTPTNADYGKTIKVVVTGTGDYAGNPNATTTGAVKLKAVISPTNEFVQGAAPSNMKFTIGEGIPAESLGAASFGGLAMDTLPLSPGSGTFSVGDGSLIISFSQACLNRLSVGVHTIQVTVTGSYAGSYTAEITVKAPNAPNTGDSGNLLAFCMLLLAGTAILILLLKGKNKVN